MALPDSVLLAQQTTLMQGGINRGTKIQMLYLISPYLQALRQGTMPDGQLGQGVL